MERLQSRHLILIKILRNPRKADKELSNVVGSGGSFSTSIQTILKKLLPAWEDDQIERTWNELNDFRILGTPGTKTMMTDRGIYQLENRLTSFGQQIAEFITNPLD